MLRRVVSLLVQVKDLARRIADRTIPRHRRAARDLIRLREAIKAEAERPAPNRFINDLETYRTFDPETGAELRRLQIGGGEDDRPEEFELTLDGARLTFLARHDNIRNPVDGSDALRWRVRWFGIGDRAKGIFPPQFRSEDEQRRAKAIISDAFHVHRTFYGKETRPVLEVVFVPARDWK